MAVGLTPGVNAQSSRTQDAASLRQVFQTITAESCPRFYNFHMHTVCSDGKLQPEQLMEQAIAIGLSGLAITDHHSTGGYDRAQRWLSNLRSAWQDEVENSASQSLPPLPQLWAGMEVTAELLADEVHILCYAFDPAHPDLHIYQQGQSVEGEARQAGQVIAAVHRAGGLAVLAHPARYKRSPQDLIPAAADLGIDGIETYYAYNNPSPWQPSPRQTAEVRQLGDRLGLLHTCGTDTHGLDLLQRL
ncbi:MAG: PHP domain-containing protein [Cyanobacteriota bacterium]